MIVSALSELADAAYQGRVWTGNALPEMSSFEECVETLFDDSGLSVDLGRGAVFGAEIDNGLRELSRLVDLVEASQPIDQLLGDPALAECRALAAALLEEIQHSTPSSAPIDGPV